MWKSNGYEMTMTEGDFGIELPIKISGTTITASDEVKFTLIDEPNGNTIIEKTFDHIVNNTFILELTEAESALLPVGVYYYTLDWYQDGAFMCNVVERARFKVVDKR